MQSSSRTYVQEGGATDSYQIALQSIPTNDVQISIDPDNQTNLGGGVGVAITLTFTSSNARIPQTVTVTAVDDAAVEGFHTSTITHTATSPDSNYNGLAAINVIANVADNNFGDYSKNGVVDAADYVLWRKTLGSTWDLQADGSGNGFVDQADYTFWRSNYGAVVVPSGGSGSGSGAEADVGELTSPANLSAALAAASSVASSPARSVAANGSPAVDSAFADFGFSPSTTGTTSNARLAMPATPAQATVGDFDLLLNLASVTGRQRSGDDSFDPQPAANGVSCDESDDFFTTLAVEVGQSQSGRWAVL